MTRNKYNNKLFQKNKDKNKCIFMQFDTEEFYPSILKELLLKTLTYAKTLMNSRDEEINTMKY